MTELFRHGCARNRATDPICAGSYPVWPAGRPNQAAAAGVANSGLIDATLICVIADARVATPLADRRDRCLEPAATPCR
jgi:hypothetical protein